MKKAVIVSACRTPVGKFLGSLKGFQATELGAIAVKEAVRRADLRPEQVDEVILGNVLSAGLGQNPARQVALKGGLPVTVPALTVNKVCGSGLKAVSLAAQAIRAGDNQIVIAGGMESMSNAPYLLKGGREGLRLGHGGWGVERLRAWNVRIDAAVEGHNALDGPHRQIVLAPQTPDAKAAGIGMAFL